MVGLRPLLMPSRPGDPEQPVGFSDEFRVKVPGAGASVDITDQAVYLTLSLRNAGSGLAVMHSWHVDASQDYTKEHAPLDRFITHGRDLYVAPGDYGFWQGALREPQTAAYADVRKAVQANARFTVELLYGDLEGGQRTISRFSFLPPMKGTGWTSAVSRHWHLDAPDPR